MSDNTRNPMSIGGEQIIQNEDDEQNNYKSENEFMVSPQGLPLNQRDRIASAKEFNRLKGLRGIGGHQNKS